MKMQEFITPKHHWNYFLAIEKDLEAISRYIEFSEANLNTYSIELTHILLSASSEIDVIMKQLCTLIDPEKKTNNIDDYKSVIQSHLSSFIVEEITIDRYGLIAKPWESWKGTENPIWWRGYNNVKHQRNTHFKEANREIAFYDTTRQLESASFLRINNEDYYYSQLIIRG